MTLIIAFLILITGMSGSGKTTLAQYAEKLGYEATTLGDIIRDEARKRGLEPTPYNLGFVAEAIRREEGGAAVAERCIESLMKDSVDRVVVDGIRSIEEVEAFRSTFSDILLLAVHSSPRTRFRRLKTRGRSDYNGGWEAFSERDKRELGFGVGSTIALADHVIVNEGSILDLRRAFKKLMECLDEAFH